MNSINNGWDSTKWAETSYLHCSLSSQWEMRENVRQEKTKKHENGCPRKNTLIYIHMCIYTAKETLFKYRYTYSNIYIMYYSGQMMLFDIMFESI